MSYKKYKVKGALLFKNGNNIKFTTQVSLEDPRDGRKILEILKSKYLMQFPEGNFNVHLMELTLSKNNQLETK